jgi:hypothetical protein
MLPIILAPDSRLEGLSKNWVQSNPTVHGIFQTLTHDHPFPSRISPELVGKAFISGQTQTR